MSCYINETLLFSTPFDRPTTPQHPAHHLSTDRRTGGIGWRGVMELVGELLASHHLAFSSSRGSGRRGGDDESEWGGFHWWASTGTRGRLFSTQTFPLTSVTPSGQRRAVPSTSTTFFLSLLSHLALARPEAAMRPPSHTPRHRSVLHHQ